jgi:uncharacterized membrane protein YgcG
MLRLSFLVLLVQILTQKALLLVTNSTSVGANAEDSSTTDPLVLQSILIDTQQVILLHAYVSACYWICVLILLYMCPQVLQSILIDAQPVIHRPGLEALLEAGNKVVQVLKSFTPAKEGTAESAKGGGEGGVSRSRGGVSRSGGACGGQMRERTTRRGGEICCVMRWGCGFFINFFCLLYTINAGVLS